MRMNPNQSSDMELDGKAQNHEDTEAQSDQIITKTKCVNSEADAEKICNGDGSGIVEEQNCADDMEVDVKNGPENSDSKQNEETVPKAESVTNGEVASENGRDSNGEDSVMENGERSDSESHEHGDCGVDQIKSDSIVNDCSHDAADSNPSHRSETDAAIPKEDVDVVSDTQGDQTQTQLDGNAKSTSEDPKNQRGHAKCEEGTESTESKEVRCSDLTENDQKQSAKETCNEVETESVKMSNEKEDACGESTISGKESRLSSPVKQKEDSEQKGTDSVKTQDSNSASIKPDSNSKGAPCEMNFSEIVNKAISSVTMVPAASSESETSTASGGPAGTTLKKILDKPTPSGPNKVKMAMDQSQDGSSDLRPMAKLLYGLGMDLVRQNIYKDLIKIQNRKQTQNKLNDKEEVQLEKLKVAHDEIVAKNAPYLMEGYTCSHCGFKTETNNVLEWHYEYAHSKGDRDFMCVFCGFNTKNPQAFGFHMEAEHNRKGRVIAKPSFYVCDLCSFEHNSKPIMTKHRAKCEKNFSLKRNLEPLPGDCDIPLKKIMTRKKVLPNKTIPLSARQQAVQQQAQKQLTLQQKRQEEFKKLQLQLAEDRIQALKRQEEARKKQIEQNRLQALRIQQQQSQEAARITEKLLYAAKGQAGLQFVQPPTVRNIITANNATRPPAPGFQHPFRTQPYVQYSGPGVAQAPPIMLSGTTRPMVSYQTPQQMSVGGSVYTLVQSNGQFLLQPSAVSTQPAPAAVPGQFGVYRNLVGAGVQAKVAPAATVAAPVPRSLRPAGQMPRPANNKTVARSPAPVISKPVPKSPVVSGGSNKGGKAQFEICEICGGFVKDRESLRIHFFWAHKVDIHKDVFEAGLAHLTCEACPQRFWTYQGLARHRQISHNKNKPASGTGTPSVSQKYTCFVCGDANIANILNHMRSIHNLSLGDMIRYKKCLICPKKFATEKLVKDHMLRGHPDVFRHPEQLNVSPKGQSVSNLPVPTGLFENAATTAAKKKVFTATHACQQCHLKFNSVEALAVHCDKAHTLRCYRCGLKLGDAEMQKKHFNDVHKSDKDPCELCGEKITIGRPFIRHMSREHLKKCSVVVTKMPDAEFQQLYQQYKETAVKRSLGAKMAEQVFGIKKARGAKEPEVIEIDVEETDKKTPVKEETKEKEPPVSKVEKDNPTEEKTNSEKSKSKIKSGGVDPGQKSGEEKKKSLEPKVDQNSETVATEADETKDDVTMAFEKEVFQVDGDTIVVQVAEDMDVDEAS